MAIYVCEGFVEFKGSETSMEFKQFILQDEVISFEIVGEDFDENDRMIIFYGTGVARRNDGGQYVASMEIKYPSYGSESNTNTVLMRITDVTMTPGKRRCHVSGTWRQLGSQWPFEGTLSCKKREDK